jgi:hypothetical protein
MANEAEIMDRLTTAQCLKNAHGHIAVAYAKVTDTGGSPERDRRVISETLDAVDWIRRALNHLDAALAQERGTDPSMPEEG